MSAVLAIIILHPLIGLPWLVISVGIGYAYNQKKQRDKKKPKGV